MKKLVIVLFIMCIFINPEFAAAQQLDSYESDHLDFYVLDYDSNKIDYKDVLKDNLLELSAEANGKDSSYLLLNKTDNVNLLCDMLNDFTFDEITNPVLELKNEHYVLLADYKLDYNDNIFSLVVYDITTEFGQGAIIKSDGIQYTNGEKKSEYCIDDITAIYAYQLNITKAEQVDIEGFVWRLQEEDENGNVSVDGFACNITMMLESIYDGAVAIQDVLVIDDHGKSDDSLIKTKSYDKIINNKENIAEYYDLEVHEIFLGYDEHQLRRRIKQYKYEMDISPVMVYFDNKTFDDHCSFVLDYRAGGGGYKYIPRHSAYKIEQSGAHYDYDDTFKYVTSMLAVDYEKDENGDLESLIVISPYNNGGKGAIIDRFKTTYTTGQIDYNLTLNDVVGYCFLSE